MASAQHHHPPPPHPAPSTQEAKVGTSNLLTLTLRAVIMHTIIISIIEIVGESNRKLLRTLKLMILLH